jgi:adenine-specific DNA-methyltransferase
MENNQTQEKLLAEIERLKKELKKKKKYGLVWEEKPEDVVEMCKEKLPVLKEVKGKEIITDKNKPMNLLIEGDNYHALSVLNYTHKGKIDVIYIDPPYNTGKAKEWKYNDKYVDENDGYKHSKWLNMMEKRLKLAKNILAENGVIFISINDYEGSQLKVLMDNIFIEDNFIAKLVWENKEGGGSSDSEFFRIKHEYILVYAKKKENLFLDGEYAEEDSAYNYQDEFIKERGKYKLIKLNSFSIQYSQSLDYEIKLPNGKTILPSENGKRGCWRWSKKKFVWGVENEFIVFKDNQDGDMWVYTKQYFKVDENNKPINRKTPYRGVISKWSSTLATKQLEKIFNSKKFDYPKPYELIQFLIKLYTNKNSIILDFFAGSGTTGHAVLELNNEDGGNRMFVLCTNNENDICEEVTFPRIQKVINGYDFKGNDKKILFQKKLTYSQLEKFDETIQEIKEVIEKNKSLFDKIEKKLEDNIIKIIGTRNISDKKIGLGGNLKYFKTNFVDYKESTDRNKIKLTKEAVEMLCVKEGAFESVLNNEDFKIFKNHDHYAGVIFDQSAIADFKKAIKDIKGKISVYIFSLGDDSFEDEFEDIKQKVKLSPIPEAILKVYRRIYK